MNRNRTSQPVVLVHRIDAAARRLLQGAYFPSWMICVLVAICLTIVVRVVLAKVGIDDELPAPILVYLSVTLAFTFALWLLWLS